MVYITSLFYSCLLAAAVAFPQGGLPGGHHHHGGGPGGGGHGPGSGGGQISPSYDWVFEYPLPIPPVAQAKYSEKVNGVTIRYYELTLEDYEHSVYPNLGPAHLTAYSMCTSKTAVSIESS
jgi:hypothetical protein